MSFSQYQVDEYIRKVVAAKAIGTEIDLYLQRLVQAEKDKRPVTALTQVFRALLAEKARQELAFVS